MVAFERPPKMQWTPVEGATEGAWDMARRAARVDANQREIVEALRQVGATVWLTHTAHDGAPDVVAGHRGTNYLIEIKDGDKPPSRQRLTPAEQEWHEQWRGRVDVVSSVDEVLRLIGAI